MLQTSFQLTPAPLDMPLATRPVNKSATNCFCRTNKTTHSFTHSLTHSFTHSLTHSPTLSLTHSLTDPPTLGMGVVPLQLLAGETPATLDLTGRESYTITLPAELTPGMLADVMVCVSEILGGIEL